MFCYCPRNLMLQVMPTCRRYLDLQKIYARRRDKEGKHSFLEKIGRKTSPLKWMGPLLNSRSYQRLWQMERKVCKEPWRRRRQSSDVSKMNHDLCHPTGMSEKRPQGLGCGNLDSWADSERCFVALLGCGWVSAVNTSYKGACTMYSGEKSQEQQASLSYNPTLWSRKNDCFHIIWKENSC